METYRANLGKWKQEQQRQFEEFIIDERELESRLEKAEQEAYKTTTSSGGEGADDDAAAAATSALTLGADTERTFFFNKTPAASNEQRQNLGQLAIHRFKVSLNRSSKLE